MSSSKESLQLSDSRSTMHLCHGGLSLLAKMFSEKLSADGIGIGLVDVVTALANDLSDRRFDGRNSKCQAIARIE